SPRCLISPASTATSLASVTIGRKQRPQECYRCFMTHMPASSRKRLTLQAFSDYTHPTRNMPWPRGLVTGQERTMCEHHNDPTLHEFSRAARIEKRYSNY